MRERFKAEVLVINLVVCLWNPVAHCELIGLWTFDGSATSEQIGADQLMVLNGKLQGHCPTASGRFGNALVYNGNRDFIVVNNHP